MSDKSLKPFDAAALTDGPSTSSGLPSEPSAEAASGQAAEGVQSNAPTAAEAGAAPTAQTPPDVVTRAEFMAALDEQNRRWQSTLDKRTAALTRQLQAQQNAERALEAARASGVVIPPEKQAEFLKALGKQGLLTGGPSEAPEGEGVQLNAPTDGEGLDPVTAQGFALARKYGLTGNDPEAAEIVTTSPEDYLASIVLAGQKRLARLTQAAHPNPARMPGLTPGGGPAKTDLSKKPRSELLKAEVRQAMRRGS